MNSTMKAILALILLSGLIFAAAFPASAMITLGSCALVVSTLVFASKARQTKQTRLVPKRIQQHRSPRH